jgi:hypothetical protein
MTNADQTQDLPEPDLIDRIAHELPVELRAEYYRELRHCQSLPNNDEMLLILRAMQFLTLLTVQVPGQMAIEREKLAQQFISVMQKIQENHQSSKTYQKQLDERLGRLPAQIAEGLNPSTIAAKINEGLRQEFARSTIPETGKALTLAAEQMKKATAEFGDTATMLTSSYFGVAERAQKAIDNMDGAISRAANAARQATKELSRTFLQQYRWALFALSSLALLVGIGIGMLLQHWRDQPPEKDEYINQMDLPVPMPVPIPKRRP